MTLAISLSRNLLEATGIVVLAQNMLQCGILEVELQGRSGVYCFFRGKDVVLATPWAQGVKLSAWLPQGTRVKLNGKLMRERGKVPYLATTVWVESEEGRITQEMTNKVFQEVEAELLDRFLKVAQDMAWQVQGRKDPEDGVKLIRREDKEMKRGRGDGGRGGSPPPSKRPRSIMKERFEAHTAWQPAESRAFNAVQDEVFDPQYGVTARVIRYEGEELGVLKVDDGPEILFHVNQVV